MTPDSANITFLEDTLGIDLFLAADESYIKSARAMGLIVEG